MVRQEDNCDYGKRMLAPHGSKGPTQRMSSQICGEDASSLVGDNSEEEDAADL